MAKKTQHKDVEFVVLGANGKEVYYRSFDEAAAAVVASALTHGTWTNLSVLVHSEAGARWWNGEAGVEAYRSDPDASVFDQLVVKVNSGGMIA